MYFVYSQNNQSLRLAFVDFIQHLRYNKFIPVKGEIEMIIMQEYGFLKNEVGEKEWNKMLEFLEAHENYLLSDLIYNRYIFELYEKWKNHA